MSRKFTGRVLTSQDTSSNSSRLGRFTRLATDISVWLPLWFVIVREEMEAVSRPRALSISEYEPSTGGGHWAMETREMLVGLVTVSGLPRSLQDTALPGLMWRVGVRAEIAGTVVTSSTNTGHIVTTLDTV